MDREVTEKTLKEVNWRRGTYERLGRPLVVWLPAYAIRYLARNAPDFFDWNSGLYVFKTPESGRPSLLQASLDRLDVGVKGESLSKEEKRHYEAYLNSLLEEYEGDLEFDQKARTDVLLRLARLYTGRGSYERARQLAREALALSRTIGDRVKEVEAHDQLATIALARDEVDSAKEQLREMLKAFQEVANRSEEGAALHQLATMMLERGDYETIEEQFEEALRIRQEIGDRLGEGFTLNRLGILAMEGFQQAEAGLRFLIMGLLILKEFEYADVKEKKMESLVSNLASELDYSREDFDAVMQETIESYKKERGWSLIHDAFGEDATA